MKWRPIAREPATRKPAQPTWRTQDLPQMFRSHETKEDRKSSTDEHDHDDPECQGSGAIAAHTLGL